MLFLLKSLRPLKNIKSSGICTINYKSIWNANLFTDSAITSIFGFFYDFWKSILCAMALTSCGLSANVYFNKSTLKWFGPNNPIDWRYILSWHENKNKE